MNEEWKDIVGYEGLYQVSNFGDVRRFYKGGRIKQLKHGVDNDGYSKVWLYKSNQPKKYAIHRLVAETFLPNPNNYPIVNHKNEVKTDNRVSNLEWCTPKYNCNFGTRNAKISKSQIGHKCSHSIPVACYDKEMNLISTFESSHDAMRKTGINAEDIRRCCRGDKHRHTAGGFIWKEAQQ